MRNSLFSLLFLSFILVSFSTIAQKSSVADFVNPMIGAFSPSGSKLAGKDCGRTLPGATTPFGMVQLSPDTNTGGDNGNGYSYIF